MTLRAVYWVLAGLFVILSVVFWIAPWPSPLATGSLIGCTIAGIAYVTNLFIQQRVSITYWLGAILYVVLQINFFIAPRPSLLATASQIGSTTLVCLWIADFVIRRRDKVWRFIASLRRE